MLHLDGTAILIFSDLDGCLLNKNDYSFQSAVPTLDRIRQRQIPLILASSKTEAEMRVLADEMQLRDAPLICENGGTIIWSRSRPPVEGNTTVLGASRDSILRTLAGLKTEFRFTSFQDLQVQGVMEKTGLPRDRALAALNRSSTEPLVWEDEESRIDAFRSALEAQSLTLTRGGRFWHVAGQTDKGYALQQVVNQLASSAHRKLTTIAIGDSPIDQHMLDVADYPIAIPWPDGVVHVTLTGKNGRIAPEAGALGWGIAVSQLIAELCSGTENSGQQG